MNTKLLMVVSSVFLGGLGLFSLFAAQELVSALNAPEAQPMLIIIQLMGALYVSFALINWTAKDSRIGGVYSRPISLGNFAHFSIGALALAKYQLSGLSHTLFLAALIVYAIFAVMFGWLVFLHSGIQK